MFLSPGRHPVYAAVVMRSLIKVKATYSLIIVPDGIGHICCHFLCTLKLKQNVVLHGAAAEGDKMNFLAFPRKLLNHILREHKQPFFPLLPNRAFLLIGIIEAITWKHKEKSQWNHIRNNNNNIEIHVVAKIPALH